MSKKNILLVTILALAMIVLGVVIWNFWGRAPVEPLEKTAVTFAEGAVTSPCFPITGAIVEVWNTYLPDISATRELAPGRLVDNLRRVAEREYDFRWGMSNLAYYSYEGVKMEELKGKPMKSLRTIGAFWNHEIHVMTKTDSPINNLSELKGKKIKVAVAEEKKWIAITAKEILGIHGIPSDQTEIVLVSLGEIANELRTESVDIAIVAYSVASKQASILKKETDLKFLPLSEDIIEKAKKKFPYYADGLIPADTYPNQSNDVKGIAIKGTILCSKDIDPDLVYKLLKTIFDHLDKIKAISPVLKDISLEGALEGLAIPLHPGAERYYSEKGILK